jgi:hypothetical protein
MDVKFGYFREKKCRLRVSVNSALRITESVTEEPTVRGEKST